MNSTLLVELFTEELPPKALQTLGTAFAELLSKTLRDEGHLTDNSAVEGFASPRRLACRITNVAAVSPEKKIQERLLPVKIGLDANGQPTPPLQKNWIHWDWARLVGINWKPSAMANRMCCTFRAPRQARRLKIR